MLAQHLCSCLNKHAQHIWRILVYFHYSEAYYLPLMLLTALCMQCMANCNKLNDPSALSTSDRPDVMLYVRFVLFFSASAPTGHRSINTQSMESMLPGAKNHRALHRCPSVVKSSCYRCSGRPSDSSLMQLQSLCWKLLRGLSQLRWTVSFVH